MSIKKISKINNELIDFSKSEFLKYEINEAFFIWNQNEYFTKEFSDISLNDRNYLLFLDWFIYDYELITLKKSLASLYWEENKNEIPNDIVDTHRSIFDFKKISIDTYEVKDIIKKNRYELIIKEELPSDTSLISLRVIKYNDRFFTISHIVAYDTIYNTLVYDSISKVLNDNNVKSDTLCRDYFYIIEKRINKAIERNTKKDNIEKNTDTFKIRNYSLLIKRLRKNKNLQKIIDNENGFSIYSYYDQNKNEFGSIKLSKEKIIFNDFKDVTLKNLIKNLNKLIIKQPTDVSDIWLKTKLKILDNKTPMDAIKNKKNLKKLKTIISELELLYESRLSDDEPFINPDYVSKKLGL